MTSEDGEQLGDIFTKTVNGAKCFLLSKKL